jgi:hypothetical protein
MWWGLSQIFRQKVSRYVAISRRRAAYAAQGGAA